MSKIINSLIILVKSHMTLPTEYLSIKCLSNDLFITKRQKKLWVQKAESQ